MLRRRITPGSRKIQVPGSTHGPTGMTFPVRVPTQTQNVYCLIASVVAKVWAAAWVSLFRNPSHARKWPDCGCTENLCARFCIVYRKTRIRLPKSHARQSPQGHCTGDIPFNIIPALPLLPSLAISTGAISAASSWVITKRQTLHVG